MAETSTPQAADRAAPNTLGWLALAAAVWLPALRVGAELIMADMDYTWFFPEAKEAPTRLAARCLVSLTRTSFLIRPVPLLVPEPGSAFLAYASSPYCPTNFVNAFGIDEAGKFRRVLIDNHPSRHLGYPPSDLARLAYIDIDRFEPTFSPNDYLHIVMETWPYGHSEVLFEARVVTNQGRRFVESVAAYSPDYVAVGAGQKQRFRGAPRRLLWEFEVRAWTNIEGRLYASYFTYKRYDSVVVRVDRDNLEAPVQCWGRLVGVRPDGLESLTDMLAQQLEVTDYRPSAHLNNHPVVYQVSNGVWFAEGSPELATVVSAKKRELVLRPQLGTRAAPQPKGYVVAFGALLLAPGAFFVLRLIAAKRRQHLRHQQ